MTCLCPNLTALNMVTIDTSRYRPVSCHSKRAVWCCGQVFGHMQARGVDADVVTCCSLISALERGGQWHLAQQLFLDMCRAAAAAGSPQVRFVYDCASGKHRYAVPLSLCMT
jgi:pentatricopeptide repeat protein